MMLILDDDITPRNKWKKSVIDELIKVSCGKVSGATLRICAKGCKANIIERVKFVELNLYEMGTKDRLNQQNDAANADSTLSWRRSLSYKNQPKSTKWFLYDSVMKELM